MSMSERDSYGDEYCERAQWEKGYSDGYAKGFADAKKKYSDRPHGEWILDAVSPCSISWFRCSYCGYKYEAYKQSNFCPNCGAKMIKKEGDAE